MKKKTLKKLEDWKRLFAQGCENLNDNPSWKDILLTGNLTGEELINLFEEAEETIGTLTAKDNRYLFSLPYYDAMVDALEEISTTRNWDEVTIDNDTRICFVRRQVDNMVFVDATIVTKQDVDVQLDMCSFAPYEDEILLIVNTTVRYAKETPREWLDEVLLWFKGLGITMGENHYFGH